jgi:DNA repair protein RadD
MPLRPYQTRGLQQLADSVAAGCASNLLVLPTGGGKTVIAVEGIIQPAVEQGRRVWFLAPRKQLVLQTGNHLAARGIDYGVQMADHPLYNPAAKVQVCSVQTLLKRLGRVAAPDTILIDEAHLATDENGLGTIIKAFPKAQIIGLTATPWRFDGKGLGRVFKTMHQVASIRELLEGGYLVPPRWFDGGKPDLKGVKTTAGDYNLKQLDERANTTLLIGDIVEHWIRHGEQQPTVAFAVSIAHSQHMTEMFNSAGIPAAHIDCDTPDSIRAQYIHELIHGKVKILTSCGVFTMGFDCPAVGCVILARPTKSLSLYIQMGGRGLRPKRGIAQPGEYCVFLDHAGLFGEHGSLIAEQEWSLADNPKQRRAEKKKDEEEEPEEGNEDQEEGDGLPQVIAGQLRERNLMDGVIAGSQVLVTQDLLGDYDGQLQARATGWAEIAGRLYRGNRMAGDAIREFAEKYGSNPRQADMEGAAVRVRWNPAMHRYEWRVDAKMRGVA